MPSAFAVSVYRRLYASQVVSIAGTGLATVALGLLAYDLAGADAGLVLGAVFAIKMAAYVVLGPLAAAALHRARPRTVLVVADLVRVVAALGLPFVTDVWQVYALVLVLQGASAAHTPAYQALLPRVLRDGHAYTQALGQARVVEDLEMVAAPVLAAALLLVVPTSALFVGTSAGFLASAALVARLRLALPGQEADGSGGACGRAGAGDAAAAGPPPAAAEASLARRAVHGIVLMTRTPALRPVLALNLAVAAAGAFVLVQNVVVARSVLGLGDDGAAALLAALGAGSTAVAVLLPRALDHLPERRLMLGGTAILTAATAAVPVVLRFAAGAPGVLLVAFAWFAVGAGWSAAETPVGRILRRSASDAELGSVYAAQFSLSHACWLLTYPLAGWLGVVLGLGPAAAVLGAVAAGATAATALLWPRGGGGRAGAEAAAPAPAVGS